MKKINNIGGSYEKTTSLFICVPRDFLILLKTCFAALKYVG